MCCKFITLVMFVLVGGVSYASGEMDVSKTDIIERVINFVIFVALMWYLVADKIRAILTERSRMIGEQLSQAQVKVRESREKKEKALQRLKEANEQANEILSMAKKEAYISVRNIEEKTKDQIATFVKLNEETMVFQEHLLYRELIGEILQEAFSSPAMNLDVQDYASILEKKVV